MDKRQIGKNRELPVSIFNLSRTRKATPQKRMSTTVSTTVSMTVAANSAEKDKRHIIIGTIDAR